MKTLTASILLFAILPSLSAQASLVKSAREGYGSSAASLASRLSEIPPLYDKIASAEGKLSELAAKRAAKADLAGYHRGRSEALAAAAGLIRSSMAGPLNEYVALKADLALETTETETLTAKCASIQKETKDIADMVAKEMKRRSEVVVRRIDPDEESPAAETVLGVQGRIRSVLHSSESSYAAVIPYARAEDPVYAWIDTSALVSPYSLSEIQAAQGPVNIVDLIYGRSDRNPLLVDLSQFSATVRKPEPVGPNDPFQIELYQKAKSGFDAAAGSAGDLAERAKKLLAAFEERAGASESSLASVEKTAGEEKTKAEAEALALDAAVAELALAIRESPGLRTALAERRSESEKLRSRLSALEGENRKAREAAGELGIALQ